MRLRALAGALLLAGLMSPAFATNGYFSHGYGIKSKGMAGVGIAYGQDALAAATNPANMVLVGNRWDVGLDYFRPQRETTLDPAFFGPFGGTYDGNNTENFFIPEFGYNQMISNNMSLGVSVYGNGGMNTDYGKLNTVPLLAGVLPLGNGNLGVDLMQLFIAPTWAMKVNDHNAIGVTLKIAYQRFKAYGLQNFDGPASSSPGNVTNNGYDSAWGYGIGLGWTGQLTPTFSVGVTYQSRTWMQKFDKYKGLFAEQGDFDIPENYGIGFAWQATPQLTLAADVQRINYGGIKSIANRGGGVGNCFSLGTCKLGDSNGPGFGWENITAYKLGVSYDLNKEWTLRAGYSWNDVPYAGTETFFNMLAPGVIKEHATLGATWRMPNGGELSFAYMHAFKNTVNGISGVINNTMYEDSFGVAYGMKF
jgi:long-chain fatty acid transport protein